MKLTEIISHLPYSFPFLFVDEITRIDEKGVEGNYLFRPDAFFYRGHFKDAPVTPGVILTECMAQIGVVCLGIYLLETERSQEKNIQIAMSSSEVDFFQPVLPGEMVKVVSQKEYFRFNKLKCITEMYNSKGKLVCRGKIAGMVFQPENKFKKEILDK
ncbi:hydroxymyristoyl-ACP dehydratase [Antarcticibacterium arcticum]|uniref:Hydroxymyristoyl-ACP dehydratase n=1 Tax=Antarcticibacterium arcticum TaxID=2585771 RepID=A0A5B8YH88_9FLAO|nr:FabA/FabZ family ACP-dehydratase [Antarcticibacterium arcticum]QED36941.1 hydroxymyristoyl-ACP dehydratase [Antarcticibacterium arcticum]